MPKTIDPRQMQFQYGEQNPPIIFELKELPEHLRTVKHHCTMYPCVAQSTYYFIAQFGDVAKMVTGVCDEHAHIMDEFLTPVKLSTN